MTVFPSVVRPRLECRRVGVGWCPGALPRARSPRLRSAFGHDARAEEVLRLKNSLCELVRATRKTPIDGALTGLCLLSLVGVLTGSVSSRPQGEKLATLFSLFYFFSSKHYSSLSFLCTNPGAPQWGPKQHTTRLTHSRKSLALCPGAEDAGRGEETRRKPGSSRRTTTEPATTTPGGA